MTESIKFLFQRISVAIQRFNAVLLNDGFPSEDHPDYSFSQWRSQKFLTGGA